MKIPTPNYVTTHQLTDYVTKREFNDFREEMRNFRGETTEHFNKIDVQLTAIESRLGGMDVHFNSVEKRFNDMDKRFDNLEETMRIQNGALVDEFKHQLKIGLEFLQSEIKRMVQQEANNHIG